MLLQVNQRKKLKQQEVEVQQGLTVLVGTNGSGKSSFLESLFFNHILRDIRQLSPFDNCIVYSSGVNESFTPLYQAQLKVLYNNSLKLVSNYESSGLNARSKYYFSKDWVPFLLLASTFLAKEDSNTTKWMNKFELKATYFEFEVYIPSSFKTRLRRAHQNIEKGRADYGFESSQLVRFLNTLVGDSIEEKLDQSRIKVVWGSKDNLGSNPQSVMNDVIFSQIFDTQLFASLDSTVSPVDSFFQMLQVLSFGGSRTKYISLELSTIVFSRDTQLIGLHDLSDGEFQILLNSALLDLFDNEKALFLLDEVDAHIHPTMVKRVWSSFRDVKGYAFTTSHNLLTISNSEYNRIIFLEDGTIISDTSKKVKLVDDICGTLFGAPIWKSLLYTIENLVLIDGLGDWEIFKALIQKQGINFEPLNHNLLVIERSSGTDKRIRENLEIAKVNFVKEMIDIAKKSGTDRSQIRLKNIFLICDSDAYVCHRNNLTNGLDIKKHNDLKEFNVHSIVWNRRDIESYLISPTARIHYDNSSKETFSWGSLENFGNLTEALLSQERMQRVDCKDVIRTFIGNTGFDKPRMHEYIDRMNASEIDPYLKLVFDELIRIKNTSA